MYCTPPHPDTQSASLIFDASTATSPKVINWVGGKVRASNRFSLDYIYVSITQYGGNEKIIIINIELTNSFENN